LKWFPTLHSIVLKQYNSCGLLSITIFEMISHTGSPTLPMQYSVVVCSQLRSLKWFPTLCPWIQQAWIELWFALNYDLWNDFPHWRKDGKRWNWVVVCSQLRSLKWFPTLPKISIEASYSCGLLSITIFEMISHTGLATRLDQAIVVVCSQLRSLKWFPTLGTQESGETWSCGLLSITIFEMISHTLNTFIQSGGKLWFALNYDLWNDFPHLIMIF
jgi:hypothetical protein